MHDETNNLLRDSVAYRNRLITQLVQVITRHETPLDASEIDLIERAVKAVKRGYGTKQS